MSNASRTKGRVCSEGGALHEMARLASQIHSEGLCVQSSINAPVASKHATRRVAACAGSMRVMDAADVGGDPVLDPLVE